MATRLQRREFRKQYAACRQGLFILANEKLLPKDQPELNIGQTLSEALCGIAHAQRKYHVQQLLQQTMDKCGDVTVTHIEILFTPSLEQDAAGLLLSHCRNKKICVVWPGSICDDRLTYAAPESPEYYEAETARFVDTYIITD